MKLLFTLFCHLTENILPHLAIKHGWDTCHEKDIKHRICTHLSIRVPVYPSRSHVSTQDLKKIILCCYDLIDNPVLFLTLPNDIQTTTPRQETPRKSHV